MANNVYVRNLADVENLSSSDKFLISQTENKGLITKNVTLEKVNNYIYENIRPQLNDFLGEKYAAHDHTHEISDVTDFYTHRHTVSEISDFRDQKYTMSQILDLHKQTHIMDQITDLSNQTHLMSAITDLSNQTHTMSEITDLSNQIHTISQISDFYTHIHGVHQISNISEHIHDVNQISNISEHTHNVNQLNDFSIGVFSEISSLTFTKMCDVMEVGNNDVVTLSDQTIVVIKPTGTQITFEFSELVSQTVSRHAYLYVLSSQQEIDFKFNTESDYSYVSEDENCLINIIPENGIDTLIEFIEISHNKFFVRRHNIKKTETRTADTIVITWPLYVDMYGKSLKNTIPSTTVQTKKVGGEKYEWSFGEPDFINNYTFHGWKWGDNFYQAGQTIYYNESMTISAVYNVDKKIIFLDDYGDTIKEYTIYDNKIIKVTKSQDDSGDTIGSEINTITYPVINGPYVISWDAQLPDIVTLSTDMKINCKKVEIVVESVDNDDEDVIKNGYFETGENVILLNLSGVYDENGDLLSADALIISEDQYLTII